MQKIKINSKKFHHIGILSAMPQEIGSALENLNNIESNIFGDLKSFPEN